MRAPVNRRGFFVGNTFFHQARKKPLFPTVVFRATGCQFALPVITKPQQFELVAHIVNILIGPFRGRDIVLDGRILRWHSERIPAHRLQYILTQHALIARHHITNGVIAHMAHVQLSTGIGKHRQAIVFFLIRLFADDKGFMLIPEFLSGAFTGFGVVILIHIDAYLFDAEKCRKHTLECRRHKAKLTGIYRGP